MTDHNSPACTCTSDPFTWIVDDLGDMVICFGCRTCHTTWTRLAPEPMQKQHRRIQERNLAKELLRLDYGQRSPDPIYRKEPAAV